MHTMLKMPSLLAALFVTCFVPGFADGPKAQSVETKTYNLQGHEKRINAYYAKMSKPGKENTLSQELIAVYNGMKKGSYKYDHATTRKVLQEVYAKRMPAAAKGGKHPIETQNQK